VIFEAPGLGGPTVPDRGYRQEGHAEGSQERTALPATLTTQAAAAAFLLANKSPGPRPGRGQFPLLIGDRKAGVLG